MDEKALLERLDKLEKEVKRLSYAADTVDIQNLMSRYIFYMENGRIGEVWDDLWTHTNPDVRVEIMDSGAYLGQEHVKRVWDTMARRVDVNGNPVSAAAGQMSNTNTDRAFLLLMLTISSPMIEVSEDGTHAWGQWHIFGPHTNRVFDPEVKMKKDTAFWIAGKYDNEFVKEDGEWKILKLHPICWLRTPYHKDFLECPDCRRTPSPYYPPDEPPTIHSFNPDEGNNPDKWGPFPHAHIVHK
jgi:hypothetical protein